ncbi:NAD(P)-dependent oxidoreductase [Mangrovicoccus sp. HB161399]|uniref:NAD(P)-dependent oxidoreductase n=1 Tax=Mangrovicoccus sp. HB161399 TaxID=2720392 RepID=UPI001552B6F2|nr:NAD(P)-dependent oxidoreductase [Mangrovicoccus sp. HB161399]
MAHDQSTPGIVSSRLDAESLARNFADPQGRLGAAQAAAEAARCLFCADAPCVSACAARIDVPGFIGRIRDGDPEGAAAAILEANILGSICARVCPADMLCEGACPVEEGGPVKIARLQRYATDLAMEAGAPPFVRAAPTGRRVAVVGGGPAGLACAHRLALLGHEVVLMESRAKAGGLNEYGIAAYKTPAGFAQQEVAWLLSTGGIELRTGMHLGRDITLQGLQEEFDAVFLSVGLAGVNALRAEGAGKANVHDAVDFIAGLRQQGWQEIPVGRDVVVIGGGMTALETAVQAKLLGAQSVTMVYRRSEEEMSLHAHERQHAASKGVRVVTGAEPLKLHGDGAVAEVEFLRTEGTTFRLPADQVFKAIGQCLEDVPGGLRLEGGKIAIGPGGRSSVAGVWAGGDCATGGSDLTVEAVAQGRDAAEDIHRALAAA